MAKNICILNVVENSLHLENTIKTFIDWILAKSTTDEPRSSCDTRKQGSSRKQSALCQKTGETI